MHDYQIYTFATPTSATLDMLELLDGEVIHVLTSQSTFTQIAVSAEKCEGFTDALKECGYKLNRHLQWEKSK